MRIVVPLFDSAPDVIPEDASAGIWTRANGVQFRAGMAERVAPAVHFHATGEPAGPYLAIMSIGNAAGEYYWLVVTQAGIWATNGATWSNVTPASGWAATAQSIITVHGFNGVAIINDSIGGPFYWDVNPANKALRLPGWPTGWRVVAMRSHSAFLFGIGRLDMGGVQRVVWSDAAEAGTLPGTWQPAADNLAGWVDLLPAVSPCVDAISIGNELLVFKGESVHAFTFVGGLAVFDAKLRFASVGLGSVGGFCKGPKERFLFAGSHGDVMISDGVSYDSILSGKAQRTYYDALVANGVKGLIQGATLARLGLSVMAFAERGGSAMTQALIFDWATGAVSFRGLPPSRSIAEGRALQDVTRNSWANLGGTWNAAGRPWNAALSAATGDDVMVGGSGLWLISDQQGSGTAEPVYLLKESAPLGSEESNKLVRHVFPKIRGSGEVSLRIGTSDEAQGPIRWTAPQRFPIGQGAKVDVLAQGRFISIEVQSIAGEDAAFSVGSIAVEAVETGRW